MSRYYIEQVKCEFDNGGIACGSVGGAVCTSVKFRKDNESSLWLELDEIDGMPQFYLSDEDQLDLHLNIDPEDDDAVSAMNANYIEEFEGINLSDDYDDLYDQFANEQKDNPATDFLRYIILVTRCSTDELEGLINMATGKYIDELEIPLSEEEQEYMSDVYDCGGMKLVDPIEKLEIE